MACPFLEDVLNEEALIFRRAFRHERVFQDRSDPLAFGDDYLVERYRFSGDELKYLCRLLGPKVQHQTEQSHALTVPQMVCVTLRWFASGSFLYSVGDAENLNKGTICPHNKTLLSGTEVLQQHVHHLPWPQKTPLHQGGVLRDCR